MGSLQSGLSELGLAPKKSDSKETVPGTISINEAVAARRLPAAFDDLLLESNNNARRFLETLSTILYGIKYRRLGEVEINEHTIMGISQIAHIHRDRVGPANRKSYDREVIHWILKLREKVLKKPPLNYLEYLCEQVSHKRNGF